MNAWTSPIFWRFPFESCRIGRSRFHLQAFAEHVARPCVDRAAQSGERVELLATGESIAQSEIARQIPDVATRGDAVRMRIAAEDRRTARGRMDEPEEEADRRRLACPVGAEVAEHLATLDRQVEVGQRPHLAAVGLCQSDRLDRRCGHRSIVLSLLLGQGETLRLGGRLDSVAPLVRA